MESLLALLLGIFLALSFGLYCDWKHDKECETIRFMTKEEYKKYLEKARNKNEQQKQTKIR